MDKKMKVLFLSTGNSTRGQMAEGFARQFAGDRLVAVNAGTRISRFKSAGAQK